MRLYVYPIPMELESFYYVLATAAAAAARAGAKEAFLNSKIFKKHKNVSAMSKKTSGCRRKIIKNAQKRRKTIEILFIDVNFGQKGVFLPYFGP